MTSPPAAPSSPASSDQSNEGDRPTLAILCRTLPPYQQHLHRRIANEIPELRLATLDTHKDGGRDWKLESEQEIGFVQLPNAQPAAVKQKLPGWLSPGRLWQSWKQGGAAIDLLTQADTRAVLVSGYNDPCRLRLIAWCKKQSIPCFVFGDSNIKSEAKTPAWKASIKRQLISWIGRTASGVLAYGRYGVAYWKHYGVPEEKVFTTCYEPDYRLIQDLPQATIDTAAAEHGLRPDRRRLVFSGRFIPVKCVDLLVKAFIQLANDRPEWDLVMLGDGPLKEELQAVVPSHLAERVHWIPFQNRQEVVSAIYRSCDALVLPSSYEPWALVINEAVAADLAVVATDVVGAAAELVADGVNGRIVPPNNLEALRRALYDVTDPDKIDRMRTASADQLADWRRRGDPVKGIREALAAVGALDKA